MKKKTGPKKVFLFSKSELKRLYITESKSYLEIAKHYACGETTIYKAMREFGIPARPKSECLKISIRKRGGFTLEHREKMSLARIGKHKGKLNNKWKNGATTRNLKARLSGTYVVFRAKVLRFKGDKCNECGKSLLVCCRECGHRPDRHVHHIKQFHLNYHDTYTLDDTMVLCESCHAKQHRKKGPSN